MKISKTAVLTLGTVLLTAGLGLMFVSAINLGSSLQPGGGVQGSLQPGGGVQGSLQPGGGVQGSLQPGGGVQGSSISNSKKELYNDMNNAVQHFEKIKFISGSKDSNDYSEVIMNSQNSAIRIDSNNFVLSGGNVEDSVSSSILGGINNTIRSEYSVIIGGVENTISENNNRSAYYSVIVGGKGVNKINGVLSTILGSNNQVGYRQTAVGHSQNINGEYSLGLGKNNHVGNGYAHSVVLGSSGTVDRSNSFLWNDGNQSVTLHQDNVFMVNGKNGMVVGTNKAHSFAKLTIGGPLVIYTGGNTNNLVCNADYKGVLRVVQGDSRVCFCGCDGAGSGWHSLHGGGTCLAVCNQGGRAGPLCNSGAKINYGNKYEIVNGCIRGKVVEGTGAYFVDKDDRLHWTCEEGNGATVSCVSNSEVDSLSVTVPNPECDYVNRNCNPGTIVGTVSNCSDDSSKWCWKCELGVYTTDCRIEKGIQRGDCIGKPDHSEWKNGKFKQTEGANGLWIPENSPDPRPYTGNNSVECTFECNNGWTWSGGINRCVQEEQLQPGELTCYPSYEAPEPYKCNSGGSVIDGTGYEIHKNTNPLLPQETIGWKWYCGEYTCVECKDGYVKQGDTCVLESSGHCIGTGYEERNATLIPNSVNNLGDENVNKVLYRDYITAMRMVMAYGKKCVYYCKAPYVYQDDGCVMPGDCNCPDDGKPTMSPGVDMGPDTYKASSCDKTGWVYSKGTPGACEWTCKDNYKKSGNTCVSDSSTVCGKHTLYFQAGNCSRVTPSSSISVTGGTTVVPTNYSNGVPSSNGSFLGWSTSPNGSITGLYYMPCNNDATLYAVCSDNPDPDCSKNTYKLTFDRGSCKSVSPSSKYVSGYTQVDIGNYGVSMATPNEGDDFAGWSTSPNGSLVGNYYLMPCNDSKLYAICTSGATPPPTPPTPPATATLTYDANGCGTPPDSVTMTYAASVSATGMKTINQGWTFIKWNTKADGSGTGYAKGGLVKGANVSPNPMTLYAQCTPPSPATATLTYDANGCGTPPDSVTMTYAASVSATGMKTINQGWIFNKWNTKADGSGTGYNKGQLVKGANVSPNPMTLYAQCTPPSSSTATLTYHANGCGTAPDPVTLTYAGSAKAKSMVPVSDKVFQEWCRTSNGGGTCYTVGQTVKEANTNPSNIDLYAICRDVDNGACETTEVYGCKNSSNAVNKIDTTGDTQWKWYCVGLDGTSPLCTKSCPSGQELKWTSLHNGACVKNIDGECNYNNAGCTHGTYSVQVDYGNHKVWHCNGIGTGKLAVCGLSWQCQGQGTCEINASKYCGNVERWGSIHFDGTQKNHCISAGAYGEINGDHGIGRCYIGNNPFNDSSLLSCSSLQYQGYAYHNCFYWRSSNGDCTCKVMDDYGNFVEAGDSVCDAIK